MVASVCSMCEGLAGRTQKDNIDVSTHTHKSASLKLNDYFASSTHLPCFISQKSKPVTDVLNICNVMTLGGALYTNIVEYVLAVVLCLSCNSIMVYDDTFETFDCEYAWECMG